MTRSFQHFDGPVHALVQGASRGLGLGFVRVLLEQEGVDRVVATSRRPETSEGLLELRETHGGRLELVPLDVSDEASVRAAARSVGESVEQLHLLLNVAGLLHDDERGIAPEKSLSDIEPANLRRSFAVNAIGPLLVAKHFHPFFEHGSHAVFANMSARVGSIGDNYKGGWYGYRASKAAQNQFTRTLAIEMDRRAPETVCVALHPGTVDTGLSEPFQTYVPEEQLFTVEESTDYLMDVIDGLTQEDHGGFFDWAGEPIEW